MDARAPRYGRSTPFRRLALALLLAFAATFLLAAPSANAAATLGCADDASGTVDLSAWAPEMLAATNAHRTSRGLAALQLDPTLTRAAVWKSRDLARRNYFAHDDPALGAAPARSPWERLTSCGFSTSGARAENIAAGQRSGADYIQAWLDSPGHRANIENGALRYVGFGIASSDSSSYGTYATQMFSSVANAGAVTPPPLVVAPAAPTVTALTFAIDGDAKLVCPPITDPFGTAYVQDVVGAGGLDVSRTAAGCLRIAPPAGAGGIATTVTYHALGTTGLTSAIVTLHVTVDEAPRTLDGGGGTTDGPAPPAPTASHLRSTTSVVTHRRCRGPLAVAGWCWSVTTRGQLVAADGTALAGQRIAVSRRMATGRSGLLGTTTTSGTGAFRLVRPLRPSGRGTVTWIRRNVGSIRFAYAGNGSTAATARTVTSSIA